MKKLLNLQRDRDPQIENHCSKDLVPLEIPGENWKDELEEGERDRALQHSTGRKKASDSRMGSGESGESPWSRTRCVHVGFL